MPIITGVEEEQTFSVNKAHNDDFFFFFFFQLNAFTFKTELTAA